MKEIKVGDMVIFKSPIPAIRGYSTLEMNELAGHSCRVTSAHESASQPGITVFRVEYQGKWRSVGGWWFHEDQVEPACGFEDDLIDKDKALEAWSALMS